MNEKYNKILINIINNKMNDLDIFENRIYNIFNKCDESIQIDFIKLLFILDKQPLNNLTISNIGTIKKLLKWGCVNSNLPLVKYVLTHKDIKLESNFYYSLENLSKSRELVEFITNYRIKDTYENENDDEDNNDSDSYSNSDSSSSIFSSDLDNLEEDSDTQSIKYGKHINPEDVEEVD
jgi:hypothetical protein